MATPTSPASTLVAVLGSSTLLPEVVGQSCSGESVM